MSLGKSIYLKYLNTKKRLSHSIPYISPKTDLPLVFGIRPVISVIPTYLPNAKSDIVFTINRPVLLQGEISRILVYKTSYQRLNPTLQEIQSYEKVQDVSVLSNDRTTSFSASVTVTRGVFYFYFVFIGKQNETGTMGKSPCTSSATVDTTKAPVISESIVVCGLTVTSPETIESTRISFNTAITIAWLDVKTLSRDEFTLVKDNFLNIAGEKVNLDYADLQKIYRYNVFFYSYDNINAFKSFPGRSYRSSDKWKLLDTTSATTYTVTAEKNKYIAFWVGFEMLDE